MIPLDLDIDSNPPSNGIGATGDALATGSYEVQGSRRKGHHLTACHDPAAYIAPPNAKTELQLRTLLWFKCLELDNASDDARERQC